MYRLRFLCCYDKYCPKPILERKGFIWLTCYSLSSGEIKVGTRKQKLNKDHREVLLTGWFLSYLANMDQNQWLGVSLPSELGPLYQLALKKINHSHNHRPVRWRQSPK